MKNNNIKTINFSELKDEDKQELSKFIKGNRMKFQKDEKNKKYITLIHLINPNFINNKQNEISINTKRRDEYSIKYNKNYPTFFSNLNIIIGIRAKKMNINELRLFIEELYSIRYVDDTIKLKNQFLEKKYNPDYQITLKYEESFPLFVYNSIIQKYNNKTQIVQFSLNLLESVDYFKNDFDDIKFFSYFLDESYNKDDLIFFLFLRNCIEKETNISFIEKVKDDINIQRKFSCKKNLIDTEIFLNKDLCSNIAYCIFGNDEPILYNSFMIKCGNGVNAYQLLKFSIEDFHESRKNHISIQQLENTIEKNYNFYSKISHNINSNKNNNFYNNYNNNIENNNNENNNNIINNYYKINYNENNYNDDILYNNENYSVNFFSTYNIESRLSSLKDNKSYSYSPSNQDIRIIIHSDNKNIYNNLISKYEKKWNIKERNNTIVEICSEYFKRKVLIDLFDSIFSNLSDEIKSSFDFDEKVKQIQEIIAQKFYYLLNCLLNNDLNKWFQFLNINKNNISAQTHYNFIFQILSSIQKFNNIKEFTEDILEDFSKNILTTEEFMTQIMSLIENTF